MSDLTRANLDAAIANHIADEYGDTTAGWVVVTETTTFEQLDNAETSLIIEARPMQSDFLTQGLLHAALNADTNG